MKSLILCLIIGCVSLFTMPTVVEDINNEIIVKEDVYADKVGVEEVNIKVEDMNLEVEEKVIEEKVIDEKLHINIDNLVFVGNSLVQGLKSVSNDNNVFYIGDHDFQKILLEKDLVRQNLDKIYYEMELPLEDVLFDMENCGFKVDTDIIILGVYYVLVILCYIIFEMIPINYRPVLINGFMESSYPSSTTLLVLSVMPTLIFQLKHRMKNIKLQRIVTVITILFCVFMVVGRLISGVHWVTDIIGSVLLSAGLFYAYKSACIVAKVKEI